MCFLHLPHTCLIMDLGSQELSDSDELSLFQVLKLWENSVEILSKIQDLLWNFNDLFFLCLGDLDQLVNNAIADEIFSLQLFTDLESHVDCAYCHEWGSFPRQLIVVHGHLGQEHSHVVDKELHALWIVTACWNALLLLAGKGGLSLVPNVEDILQVDAKEVYQSGCWDFIVNNF